LPIRIKHGLQASRGIVVPQFEIHEHLNWMHTRNQVQSKPMTAFPETQPLPPIDYATPTTPKAVRLMSLDVFRGITIAGMLLVNNPGKGTAYGPLEHADWHGSTPTELIFPFFLFIVGVATPFTHAKRLESRP